MRLIIYSLDRYMINVEMHDICPLVTLLGGGS